MDTPVSVLLLCTGNSCRSIMAEALLNHYGKGKVFAFSAGSFPTGKVHPMSLATLKRHGMSDQGYRSKSWDEFKEQPEAEFDRIFAMLEKRVKDFLRLPLERMEEDELHRRLNEIGNQQDSRG